MDFKTITTQDLITWYLIWVGLYLLFEYFRSRWLGTVSGSLQPYRFAWWPSKPAVKRMVNTVKSRLSKPFVWFRERFL